MNKEEIKLWLDKMKVENYFINDNLTVDANGDVYIGSERLGEIPIQFNEVSGGFYCSFGQLTTLKGAPSNVGGDFWCDMNQLITLEGAPESVSGYFYCHDNQLITLEGAPKSTGGSFWCPNNPLNSLEGKPDYVGGGFYIDLAAYSRIFMKDKKWSLDDVDEVPVGDINVKDEIYE